MKKKVKTKEEIEAHEHAKMLKRRFKSLVTSIKNSCAEKGLHCIELQFEFLKNNPTTKLPSPLFSYDEHIKAFEEGIEMYKGLLTNN